MTYISFINVFNIAVLLQYRRLYGKKSSVAVFFFSSHSFKCTESLNARLSLSEWSSLYILHEHLREWQQNYTDFRLALCRFNNKKNSIHLLPLIQFRVVRRLESVRAVMGRDPKYTPDVPLCGRIEQQAINCFKTAHFACCRGHKWVLFWLRVSPVA